MSKSLEKMSDFAVRTKYAVLCRFEYVISRRDRNFNKIKNLLFHNDSKNVYLSHIYSKTFIQVNRSLVKIGPYARPRTTFLV